MDLTPEEKKALTPPLTGSIVLIIVALFGAVFWSAIEGLLFGVVGAAVGGFIGWLAGAKDPRDVALTAAAFTAGICTVLAFFVRLAKATHR